MFSINTFSNVSLYRFHSRGLLKKAAKRKAVTLMYEKIKMSEKNHTANRYKDNGVFNNLCSITSTGFDEKLSMATTIDSIYHKYTQANQVQPVQRNNESKGTYQYMLILIAY
jgi:hypothetical protein